MEKTTPANRLLKSIVAATLATTMCLPVTAITPQKALAADDAQQGIVLQATGSGDTEADPIVISTADDLKEIAANVNGGTTTYAGKYLKLANDITLDSTYTPIGNSSAKAFAGTFDGAGHTVTFDNYSSAGTTIGLFGTTKTGAYIKNLIVAGSITSTNAGGVNLGAVVGYSYGAITLSKVGSEVAISQSGTTSAQVNVGGLVGFIVDESSSLTGGEMTFSGCFNHGTIQIASTSGSSPIGGIIGNVTSKTAHISISNSYNIGTFVLAKGHVGGLIGRAPMQASPEWTFQSSYFGGEGLPALSSCGLFIGATAYYKASASYANCVVFDNAKPVKGGDTAGTLPDGVTYFDPATSIADSVATLNTGVADDSLKFSTALDPAIAGGYPHLAWEEAGGDTPPVVSKKSLDKATLSVGFGEGKAQSTVADGTDHAADIQAVVSVADVTVPASEYALKIYSDQACTAEATEVKETGDYYVRAVANAASVNYEGETQAVKLSVVAPDVYYDVSFAVGEAGGGTLSYGDQTGQTSLTVPVKENGQLDQGVKATPNAGYVFGYWLVGDQKIEGATLAPEKIGTITGEVTCTAVFKKNATVAYNVEAVKTGSSPYVQTLYGGTVKLANASGAASATTASESVVSKPDYATPTGAAVETKQYWKFVGWKLGDAVVSTDETLTADAIKGNLAKDADGFYTDTAFTACFEMIEYTLTYHPNYDGATQENVVKKATPAKRGDAFAATGTFTREGYKFNSWNTAPDGSGTKCSGMVLNNMSIFGNGTTVDLYAQWVDATRDYSFTVSPSNAQVKPTIKLVDDETDEEIELTSQNASNNKQTFQAKGLLRKKSYTLTVSADGYKTHVETIPANLTESANTITVTLAKIEHCTITFDANNEGATGSMDAQQVELGQEFTLANSGFTAPTHYAFAGWNTKADGQGTAYDAGAALTLPEGSASAMTLYAQWEKTACVWADDFTIDTPATCTTAGSKSKHCTIDGCEEKIEVTELPALDHAWDDGAVTTQPTYTAPGVKTFTCTRDGCGETKTEPIPMLTPEPDPTPTPGPSPDAPKVDTVTNPDGSVTVTTTDAAKNTIVVETTLENGVVITTTSDLEGKNGTTKVSVPEQAATSTVLLPELALPAASGGKATIGAPAGTSIAIVSSTAGGASAVATVDANGKTTVVRKSAPVEGGIVFVLPADGATVSIVSAASSYPDVTGSEWYAKAGVVDFLGARGLITGVAMPDGTLQFQGDASMTRGMFATVLNRLEGEVASASAPSFADVAAGEWYSNAVAWAAECGLITGYGDGAAFGPADDITREQMATIMMRYANYLGADTSARANLDDYADADGLTFGKDAMSWAVAEGLIKGYDGTSLLGGANGATRAEVGAVLERFVTYLIVG